MEHELNVHTFYAMLDSMPKEELVAFGIMMRICMESPGRIHQMVGEINTLLRLKHTSCSCGEHHIGVDALLNQPTDESENGTVNEDNQP
jgi:hypothetical protein